MSTSQQPCLYVGIFFRKGKHEIQIHGLASLREVFTEAAPRQKFEMAIVSVSQRTSWRI